MCKGQKRSHTGIAPPSSFLAALTDGSENSGGRLPGSAISLDDAVANLARLSVLGASVLALVKTSRTSSPTKGIMVNQLMPRPIDTDRVRELDEMHSKRLGIPMRNSKGGHGRRFHWDGMGSLMNWAARPLSFSPIPPHLLPGPHFREKEARFEPF
jgi:hypothetical protein